MCDSDTALALGQQLGQPGLHYLFYLLLEGRQVYEAVGLGSFVGVGFLDLGGAFFGGFLFFGGLGGGWLVDLNCLLEGIIKRQTFNHNKKMYSRSKSTPHAAAPKKPHRISTQLLSAHLLSLSFPY
jgi:hypothetical protein